MRRCRSKPSNQSQGDFMKQIRMSVLLAAVAALLNGCSPGGESFLARSVALVQTTTNYVFAASLSLSGVSQGTSDGGDFVIVKQTLLSADLVNLARGRAPGTLLLPNEVLAAVAGGDEASPDLRLIVYDTTTQSNLAT